MKKKKAVNKETGIKLVINYFVLFAVNYLVVHFANYFYPNKVVLGTLYISRNWSLIHSMGTLALFNVFMIPVIREIENIKGRMLTDKEWMMKYFLINFVGIWVLARFANELGFGITSWTVALVLAIVLDVAQGLVMIKLEKIRK